MNNIFKPLFLATMCFSMIACVGKSVYYSSMYGTSNYNTSLYYNKVIDQEALTQFAKENQPHENMAKVIFFHSGEYSKSPQSFIEYNDLQLEGQKKYRFRAGEYVVYDVLPGAYDVYSWSACATNNDTNNGEVVAPNQDGRSSYQYKYSQLELLQNKKLRFSAGNIYVYDFKTICQISLHRNQSKQNISLLTLTELQNPSWNPLSIIYDKNKANTVVE